MAVVLRLEDGGDYGSIIKRAWSISGRTHAAYFLARHYQRLSMGFNWQRPFALVKRRWVIAQRGWLGRADILCLFDKFFVGPFD
jgi:hypothetical protein